MASYYLSGYSTPEGVGSRADVREWQRQLGVKQDGIWGPITQAAYEGQALPAARAGFAGYYNTIMNALNVPSVTVDMPSKQELSTDISAYLRPGVEQAISRRRAAGETAKAEIDADAASRGMEASTYVSSMKEREGDDVESDISMLEAQYTATLGERLAAALEKYESMNLQAQLSNAQYAYGAQNAAMGLAGQWYNTYMNNAAAAARSTASRGSSKNASRGFSLASDDMSALDYVRFVGELSQGERAMLYSSGSTDWAIMRMELEHALGSDGFAQVKAAFPTMSTLSLGANDGSAGGRSGIWKTSKR